VAEEVVRRCEDDRLTELVGKFSTEMTIKLHRQRRKGYSGWDDDCEVSFLEELLLQHVERAKSDPNQWVDVANFAAMLYHRTRRDLR
jgi:hypothetical protein